MIEIMPAILARTEEEFMAKLDKVRRLGAALHIDVMDGQFVKNRTWAPPERMRRILGGLPFESHLMVSNPEHAVPLWLACGARVVIFHAEATTRDSMICRATADKCADLSIALDPDTPVSRITEEIRNFGRIMIMGVAPGWSGQPFQDIAIEKIKMLKRLKPSLVITVDGGVKPENVQTLIEAGADVLVAGSALTESEDPAGAFYRLKKAAGIAG